jgi:hypothetical protein
MPWRHMEREEVQLLLILNLGTRWGWVVSITPQPRFIPGERTPGTHWTGGWVGPRACLDAGARRKILCPCRGSNPDRPAPFNSITYIKPASQNICESHIALMMETVHTYETSVNFYQTTRRNIPQDSHLKMVNCTKRSIVIWNEDSDRKIS